MGGWGGGVDQFASEARHHRRAVITRLAVESLRWANFAHGFPGWHTLHTERRPSPFDVARTKASQLTSHFVPTMPQSEKGRKGERERERERERVAFGSIRP